MAQLAFRVVLQKNETETSVSFFCNYRLVLNRHRPADEREGTPKMIYPPSMLVDYYPVKAFLLFHGIFGVGGRKTFRFGFQDLRDHGVLILRRERRTQHDRGIQLLSASRFAAELGDLFERRAVDG